MSAFLRPRSPQRPPVRLIGVHHAGGSASAYHPLSRSLPPSWDLLLLDLPGRGRRAAQEPIGDMRGLVAQVAADVRPWLDGTPVALFGHSLGAVVALEVARTLEDEGTGPVWVGVSGRVAPTFQELARKRLHELDDDALLDVLVAMGGTPPEVRDMPELRERLLPTVRADLRAVDTYRPDPTRGPLSCALTAFGGTDDRWAPPAAMPAWRKETSGRFEQRLYPGGHFYFFGTAFPGFARHLQHEVERGLFHARGVLAVAG
ncbi:MAG: alpha/beta fold hydrolase [Kineosporiaceae bacterium]